MLENWDTSTITEQTGYASVEQQVEQFIRAGQTLDDYRHALFANEEESEDELELEGISIFEQDPVVIKQRMELRRIERERKLRGNDENKGTETGNKTNPQAESKEDVKSVSEPAKTTAQSDTQ